MEEKTTTKKKSTPKATVKKDDTEIKPVDAVELEAKPKKTAKAVEEEPQENKVLTKAEAEELGAIKAKKEKKVKKGKKVEPLRYHPDIKHGLNDKQIQERNESGFTNYIENKNTKTYRSIFLGNIFTFFNMLCFLVAVALISVGAWSNLVFMVVILANIVIGIVQEIKAKQTIEKISLVTAPTAVVVRNKEQIEIPVSEIVLDDIILFSKNIGDEENSHKPSGL